MEGFFYSLAQSLSKPLVTQITHQRSDIFLMNPLLQKENHTANKVQHTTIPTSILEFNLTIK